jgi:hypothetical protein
MGRSFVRDSCTVEERGAALENDTRYLRKGGGGEG